MLTTLCINFSDAQGQITPESVVVSRRKFELIQAFIHVLVTCKNADIQSKMKELEWSQHFSHFKSMGNFSVAQGQLILQSLVRSSQISNSFEMVWMSLVPASMKKI